jgi:hypothetical protein
MFCFFDKLRPKLALFVFVFGFLVGSHAELVTVQLEEAAALPAFEWAKHFIQKEMPLEQTGPQTHRFMFEFGYKYADLIAGKRSFTLIPQPLKYFLTVVLCELKKVTHLQSVNAEDFTNCILSVYGPGDALEPHIDVAPQTYSQKYNFYFGEGVIGVVLQPDESGKFYLIEAIDGQKPDALSVPKKELKEKLGTVFLLQGKERFYPYYHGVSRVQNQRISLTFRTVHFSNGLPEKAEL